MFINSVSVAALSSVEVREGETVMRLKFDWNYSAYIFETGLTGVQ